MMSQMRNDSCVISRAMILWALAQTDGKCSKIAPKRSRLHAMVLQDCSACAVSEYKPRGRRHCVPMISPGICSRRMISLPSLLSCITFTRPSVNRKISFIGSPSQKILSRQTNSLAQAVDKIVLRSATPIPSNNSGISVIGPPSPLEPVGDHGIDRLPGRQYVVRCIPPENREIAANPLQVLFVLLLGGDERPELQIKNTHYDLPGASRL